MDVASSRTGPSGTQDPPIAGTQLILKERTREETRQICGRTADATHVRRVSRNIHDSVAHTEELLGLKRFGEEICEIVHGVHIRDGYGMIFDAFPNVEMASLDMLDFLMVFRVVGDVTGSGIVTTERDRFAII